MDRDVLLICGLVFGAVLLGVRAAYGVLRSRVEQKAVNRRLALKLETKDPVEVLDALRRERGFPVLDGAPGLEALATLVMQSGLKVTAARLAVWAAGLTGLFYLPLALWMGAGLLPLALGAVSAAPSGYLLLRWARARRIAKFSEQLPEALDIVVRGLRAGHPFRVAVGLVARELADPIGTEFGIMLDEIAFGLDQQEAVAHLRARVGQADLSFLAIAINIQSQTGGNLAEVLHGLARLLRSRAKMRLKVRALSSEGRLSGIFLSASPLIIFGIINLVSPAYFGFLAGNPIVAPAVAVGLILMGIGNFAIYRLVNFRF